MGTRSDPKMSVDGALSRRRFLGISSAAAMIAGIVPGSVSGAARRRMQADGGVLWLVNGRVHTMDAADTIATTVSIRNGRFDSVGQGAAGPADQIIDLGGRTVFPGLIEGHIHSVSLANRPGYHTILENTRSIREVLEVLSSRRPGVPEGQWITSMGGWHPNQWAERRPPTLAELDDAVPDRPVLLYERFTGPAITNSLGKAFFDAADAAAPVHPDIVPIAVGTDGRIGAAGFGTGGPATSALYLLRRAQTFEDRKRSALDAMEYSASVGLTAHLDQVLFPTPGPLHPNQVLSNLDHYRMYDPWLELHREGRALIRLQMNFLHNEADSALSELRERLRNQFQFFGDDMLMTGAIGEWAAPLQSDVWLESQRLVASAGWRNENSVGNLAELERVVDGYEQVAREFEISDLRWVVHHVPEVTDAQLDRLAALGCGVQMSAFGWVTSTDPTRIVGAPFRRIVDHGIQAGIEGDGVHIAPLNPWQHIYYAVTGRNSFGDNVNGDQQLTRSEALRAFTRGNSWFLRMEDRIGSIEVGKLADLVVLDRDYFAVPEEQIRDVRSVLTIVDGNVVHDAGIL